MSSALSRTCCACGEVAPREESLYVLIGEHGWRPLWNDDAPLGAAAEWFCPRCWLRYKGALAALPSSARMLERAAQSDAADDGPTVDAKGRKAAE